MAGEKFSAFAGVIPRLSARLLDPRNAATADNLQAFSGELRAWRRPLKVANVTKVGAAVRTIYRIDNGVVDFWLNWTGDVDVVPGPLAGDTSKRLYYTGDGSPKKTNLAMATAGADLPTDHFEMGLPRPTTPTVAVGGAGTAPNAERTYLLTFVNVWNEEGPPSEVTAGVTFGSTGFTVNLSNLDTGKKTAAITRVGDVATANVVGHGFRDGSRVTIAGAAQAQYNGVQTIKLIDADNFSFPVTGLPVTPATGTITAMGNYGLAKRRLYRSLVSSAGVTNWQLLHEFPDLTATTYADTTLDSALGAVITTITVGQTNSAWLEPPVKLQGLIELPGNGAAGFYENVLCFAEPGYLHAWPVRYQLTFTNRIVGIRSFGSTIVVATDGIPWTVTGARPGEMSPAKVEDYVEPSASKRSMVDGPGGVYYASPNGVIQGGLQGFANITEPFFVGGKSGNWQSMCFPATLLSVIYDGRYYGFFSDGPSQGRGFILSKAGDAPGVLFHNQYATAAYVDRTTTRLYIVQGTEILEWDADPNNLLPYDWWSALRCYPRPVNMGAYIVDGEFDLLDDEAAQEASQAADLAYNQAVFATGITEGELNTCELNWHDLNGSLLRGGSSPSFDTRYLQFQTYAEIKGRLTLTNTHSLVSKDQRRLSGNYKSDVWQYRLTGNIPVYSLKIGETPKDLKGL